MIHYRLAKLVDLLNIHGHMRWVTTMPFCTVSNMLLNLALFSSLKNFVPVVVSFFTSSTSDLCMINIDERSALKKSLELVVVDLPVINMLSSTISSALLFITLF